MALVIAESEIDQYDVVELIQHPEQNGWYQLRYRDDMTVIFSLPQLVWEDLAFKIKRRRLKS